MKSFVRMAIAAGISMSLITPGFAYVFSGSRMPEQMTRRSIDAAARQDNNVGRLEAARRRRSAAQVQDTARGQLMRAVPRNYRRLTRSPKSGTDRYRTLHPNTRSLRKAADQSMLPPRLVQTGKLYDRPTRRDIWNSAGI